MDKLLGEGMNKRKPYGVLDVKECVDGTITLNIREADIWEAAVV